MRDRGRWPRRGRPRRRQRRAGVVLSIVAGISGDQRGEGVGVHDGIAGLGVGDRLPCVVDGDPAEPRCGVVSHLEAEHETVRLEVSVGEAAAGHVRQPFDVLPRERVSQCVPEPSPVLLTGKRGAAATLLEQVGVLLTDLLDLFTGVGERDVAACFLPRQYRAYADGCFGIGQLALEGVLKGQQRVEVGGGKKSRA